MLTRLLLLVGFLLSTPALSISIAPCNGPIIVADSVCDSHVDSALQASRDLQFSTRKLLNVVSNNSRYRNEIDDVRALRRELATFISILSQRIVTRQRLSKAWSVLEDRFDATFRILNARSWQYPNVDVTYHTRSINRDFSELRERTIRLLSFE